MSGRRCVFEQGRRPDHRRLMREVFVSDFRVLSVCVGNVCRSALADVALRQMLAGSPVVVESAGTAAMVGHPMEPQAAEVARRWGVSDVEHVAQQLTGPLATGADLVLVATRALRRDVVGEYPGIVRRVFTFRQFARVMDALSDDELLAELGDAPADAADRMRALVAAVGVLRGMAPPAATPEDDDVVDPYRLPDEVFDRMASQLRPGLDAVVRLAHLAEP